MHIIIGAIVGGIINAVLNADNINSVGSFFGYFGVGALAGGVGAATGGISFGIGGVAGGAMSGLISGVSSGAILGGGNAILSNGNVWSSALQGALWGGVSGAVIGGIAGGINSYINGENVWTGESNEFLSPRKSSANTNPDEIPAKTPKDTHSTYENTIESLNERADYEVITYNGKANTSVNLENGVTRFSRPQITGYAERLGNQADTYHRFPSFFDKEIINNGMSLGINGNSSMFYAIGYVNGVKGYYTVGINIQNGIIFHRQFVPLKNWKHFHFP